MAAFSIQKQSKRFHSLHSDSSKSWAGFTLILQKAETSKLLDDLSSYTARSEPEVLKGSIARMWRSRWSTMLSIVCQDALAATLVDDGVDL